MGIVGTATKKKICFVISPIGDLGTEVRKRSDNVLDYIIRPAVALAQEQEARLDDLASKTLPAPA